MSDQQVWILTDYGKQRVSEVIASQSDEIVISTIMLGDANGEYYTPTGAETSLKRVVGSTTGYPISSKDLLEDDEGVYDIVSFGAFIQETTGGYEVREMGLYESAAIAGGTELKLFAIGVCEPINMPAVANGYDIAIDFELRLKSTNLATAYDKIYLDPKNDFLREDALDELTNVVLYVEGNLMEQISSNSHVLGLNRGQQLSEYINNTLFTYSNTSCTDVFSSLCNYVSDMSNIKSFWLFNHTNWFGSQTSVRDFSYFGFNLTLNKAASSFPLTYYGVAPSLAVTGTNSYKLPADANFHLMNTAKTADSPFTIFAVIKGAEASADNMILAQSNYFTGVHNFEILKTSSNAIRLTLFTDSSNYISFESPANSIDTEASVITIRYNGSSSEPSVAIYINGSSYAVSKTITGTYSGMTYNLMDSTSYVVDATGTNSENINSNVSILSVVKEYLSDLAIRGLNQNLLALVGKNIYYEV